MADLLDKAHIDAALNLLRADVGLTVYPDANGVTPTTPPTVNGVVQPYVRVYAHIESQFDAPGNTLEHRSGTWTVRWYCHCIGSNDISSNAVAMRVRAALLDVRPVIAGRNCGLIRREASQPANRDEDLGPVLLDRVDVYRLVTTPA